MWYANKIYLKRSGNIKVNEIEELVGSEINVSWIVDR